MDSFLRNHFLYLLYSLLGTIASLTLSIVDAVSNWWHAIVCSCLSLLPKARVTFPVNRPRLAYHPAVLVTGTSSGIGHDTAIALASSGYTVFAGVRSWEDGARVESDFLDAVRPESIGANRWAQAARTTRHGSTRSHAQGNRNGLQNSNACESDSSAPINGSSSSSSSNSNDREFESADAGGGPQHMRRRRLRRLQKQQAASNGIGGKTDTCNGSSSKVDRPGEIIPVILDVTSSESIDQAYRRVDEELKARRIPLAGIVNNAGVTAFGPMDMSAPAFIDHCMTVNFNGPVRVTQRFMPLLRRYNGRIINISSIMSWLIGPGFGVYCASKAALSAASRAWHYELASSRISVSVIEPGLTRTALWSKVESQLELHHARLNGVRVARSLHRRTAGLAAMPGDEATASASPMGSPPRSELPSDEDTASAGASGARNSDKALYSPMIRRIRTSNELAPVFALPTHHAVGAIMHALSSRYPKSTYRVGWDARLMSLATWLASEEAVEWLCRVIGIVSEN
ncbi:hypothetical protein IWW48_002317 [Coemansia sp. RSA 1200]|nr:hypothetical protein IWW48_002317 [Coemansia sp. RSA 1200]